ncbi:DNA polymerase IV [Halobacteriales archaeon QS_5_70_15]|nr:MAG: DNA polymerase IV [Halobacteriales archaeon QS_5_70_15]
MDCFYAACERLREPDLVGEPVVVGMGYEAGESHGAVATASYEAREFGVESAIPISEALDLLPRRGAADDGERDAEVGAGDGDQEPDPGATGHYRPVDMDYYESVAAEVKSILHDAAGTVREVSIDEAYLDATAVGWGDAESFGAGLKDRIESAAGVVASVGVAPNMSAAKIASDHDKPDGLVVVRPGEVREFLASLDVEALHGVGPVTARELRSMGVETAGDLAATDPHERANGRDDRPVEPQGDPKSLSSESAFVEATDEPGRKRGKVRELAAEVADRARSRGALYKTIGVKVVTPPFDVNTRARSLPGPVDDPDLVERVALDLLAEFADDRVRKLGVRVSNLEFGGEQAKLGSYADGSSASAPSDADGDGRTGPGTSTEGGTGRSRRGQTTFGDF